MTVLHAQCTSIGYYSTGSNLAVVWLVCLEHLKLVRVSYSNQPFVLVLTISYSFLYLGPRFSTSNSNSTKLHL